MALNQQSILAEYEAAKAEALRAQQSFGSQQTPSTFEGQLSGAMLGREIAPNIATQERMLMKQFMTSPSEISGRLGGAVSPLQESQLIGQQRGVLMDQLNSLADLRTNKRQELKDIIASTALGYKAQYEQQKSTIDALRDSADMSWREYTEAVRQQEHAENIRRSTTGITAAKNSIEDELYKYRIEQGELQGESWDRFTSVDKYLELRDKAYKLDGVNGLEWFDEKFPAYEQINQDVALNPESIEYQQLKRAGIDYEEEVSKADEKTLKTYLEDHLSKDFTEEDFWDAYNSYKEDLPEIYDKVSGVESVKSGSVQEMFLRYLRMAADMPGSQITDPDRIFEEMFVSEIYR